MKPWVKSLVSMLENGVGFVPTNQNVIPTINLKED
jgi:hypothetical protein